MHTYILYIIYAYYVHPLSTHIHILDIPMQFEEAPTCLPLPQGLLQTVGAHILAGLAHRQLLAAHSFPAEPTPPHPPTKKNCLKKG